MYSEFDVNTNMKNLLVLVPVKDVVDMIKVDEDMSMELLV
jgi:hypothetical protein